MRDKNLSLKAKGLLALIMSLPDDWEFTIDGLNAITKEGKTALYSAINELKEFRYCNVVVSRNAKGIIEGNDYTFFEEPYSVNLNIENPHAENPNMDNTPQLNIDYNKVKIEKNKEEEKEYKEKFSAFVAIYKKLTGKQTRGVDTEFRDFKARHKDWKEVIPLLSYAIKRETQERNEAKSHRRFFPEPKLLQTYLGKQRAWELYANVGDNIEEMENEYHPLTDGEIKWNEYYKQYIYVGMDLFFIPDGYTDEERPDGATIMLNNARGYMVWNATTKLWERKR